MGAACTLAMSSGPPPAVLEILEGPGTQHVSPPVKELHSNQDTLPELVQPGTVPLKGVRTLQCSAQAAERGVPAERRLSSSRASLPPSRPFCEPFQGPSPPVSRRLPLLARLDNPRLSSANAARRRYQALIGAHLVFHASARTAGCLAQGRLVDSAGGSPAAWPPCGLSGLPETTGAMPSPGPRPPELDR